MGRKLNLIQVQKTLEEKNQNIFTPFDFSRIFATSAISAHKFLERYTKKGVFQRAKKGLYIFKFDPAKEIVFANRIYSPSYVSLETAMSYYHLIPESIYPMTSVTTKSTREFEAAGRSFEYHKIKKEAFTGYSPISFEGEIGLMATPEKALVDYLYFVSLGKKRFNDRLDIRKINLAEAKKFARLYARKGLNKLINDL